MVVAVARIGLKKEKRSFVVAVDVGVVGIVGVVVGVAREMERTEEEKKCGKRVKGRSFLFVLNEISALPYLLEAQLTDVTKC